jgi:hypothetical protein
MTGVGHGKARVGSSHLLGITVERTIRIARQRGLPGDIVAWSKTRDEIYDRIMTRCYSAARESFTQTEDGDELDAGVLLMPMVKFLSPADPKFLSTLRARAGSTTPSWRWRRCSPTPITSGWRDLAIATVPNWMDDPDMLRSVGQGGPRRARITVDGRSRWVNPTRRSGW